MSAPRQRKPFWQDPSFLSMLGLLVLVTVAAFYREGADGVWRGFTGAVDLFVGAAPLVTLGIVLGGLLNVMVPPDMVGRWMGDGSGLAGFAIGIFAGAITPGGPYVMYPVAASLLQSGAGIGPLSGFIASRNVVTVNRFLIWELPFLGIPLAFARFVISIPMVFVASVLVPIVYNLLPGGAAADTRQREEKP